MRNKTAYMLPALVLCMSVFFTPVTAHAQGDTDTTPPTISAKLSGDTLHIEASDDSSGVDAVYIGSKRVNYRVDNAVDVAFSDYAGTDSQTVDVYAVDFAGNQSETVKIKNPHYQTPAAAKPTQAEKPETSKNPPASASADPEAEPEEKPFTPDGQASVVDNATDGDGKEFYTFTTADENVFYLVIDKQRDSDNVYFLNAVTEEDLMALAEKPEDKENESAIPEVAFCSCADKCEPGAVDKACKVCYQDMTGCTGRAAEPNTGEPAPEKPEKGGGSGTIVLLLLVAAGVGGAGYYFKIYKPKHDLDDAEDLDDLLEDSEEPEINEDGTDLPTASEDSPAQPEDTAYYDDYPDDEPEWRE